MSDDAGFLGNLVSAGGDVAQSAGGATQGLSQGGIDLLGAGAGGVGQAVGGADGLSTGAFDLGSAATLSNPVTGFTAGPDLGGVASGLSSAVSPGAAAAGQAASGLAGTPLSTSSSGAPGGMNNTTLGPTTLAANVSGPSTPPSGFGGGAMGAAPPSTPISPTDSGLVAGDPNNIAGANLALGTTPSVDFPNGYIQPPAPDGGVATTAGMEAAPTNGTTNSLLTALHDPTGGNLLDAAGKNASWLLPAAGLGANTLMRQPTIPGSKQIASEASQLGAQGQQLQSYLQSGTLPAGVQSGINAAGEAAKASIRSRYAASGQSGSSAEAQDLANVDQQLVTQGANMAMSLLQTGINESQLSSQLYNSIMQNALQEDDKLGAAISSFAAAAAGGGTRPLVIQQAPAT